MKEERAIDELKKLDETKMCSPEKVQELIELIKLKPNKEDIKRLEFFKCSKSQLEKVIDMKIKTNNNIKSILLLFVEFINSNDDPK